MPRAASLTFAPGRYTFVLILFIGLTCWIAASHRAQIERRVGDCDQSIDNLEVVIERVEAGDALSRFGQVNVATLAHASAANAGGPECKLDPGTRPRLSWQRGDEFPVEGERWRIDARVRPPWGFVNPGGFDYERWLFSEGVAGSGYVRRGKRINASDITLRANVVKVRAIIRAGLVGEPEVPSAGTSSPPGKVSSEVAQDNTTQLRWGGILLALILADGSQVSDAQWQLFRATGTIHLIIVSGLHIVIIAAMAAAPGWLLGRVVLLWMPRLPVRLLAFASGAAGAVGYTALTGFEVPAVRAAIMFLLGAIGLVLARRVPAPVLVLMAFILTTLFMPLSLLAAGFWLSFAAVLALVTGEYAIWRAPGRLHTVRGFLRSQSVLTIALIGWLMLTVGSLSLTAPLANLMVVPVVSGVVLPAALLGAAVLPLNEGMAMVLLQVADVALGWVMILLELLNELPPWLFRETSPALFLVTGVTGLLLLIPLPWQVRSKLSPVLLLPFVPLGPVTAESEFEITVLDVGQGSAALVTTRHSTLVFDAGPRYPSGFDTGEAVVLPALANQVVRSPDALIITHEDADHAGGASALVDTIPNLKVISGQERKDARSCHGFPAWRRDGVDFRLLSSAAIEQAKSANDRSCALLIDNHRVAVLLTGDTSAQFESLLLHDVEDEVRQRLEVVLVPHHGSQTSSSRAFTRLVAPRFALVSAGYRNRYGHPHPEVVSRWQQVGARVMATGAGGALIWRSNAPDEVTALREVRPRYWRGAAST